MNAWEVKSERDRKNARKGVSLEGSFGAGLGRGCRGAVVVGWEEGNVIGTSWTFLRWYGKPTEANEPIYALFYLDSLTLSLFLFLFRCRIKSTSLFFAIFRFPFMYISHFSSVPFSFFSLFFYFFIFNVLSSGRIFHCLFVIKENHN